MPDALEGSNVRARQGRGCQIFRHSITAGLCMVLWQCMAARASAQAGGERPVTPAAATCTGASKDQFLCGPRNAEDIVSVPGRSELIASGMAPAGAAAGQLYLIDAPKQTFVPLVPRPAAKAQAAFSDCPSGLDPKTFKPHGIAINRTETGELRLWVVNHGGRESIEVFAVSAAPTALTWLGCVVLPEGASGNGVVGLPDGGFAVTQFFDTRKGDWIAQLTALEPTGAVLIWRHGKGFSTLAGSEASGDNGIELSADGRSLFVNIWPEKRILKLSLDGRTPPKSIPIDFMPDNIHLAPDGSLLVGGHLSDIRTLMACKREACPVDWALARLDPTSLAIRYLFWEKGSAEFEGVTGAAQLDEKLWLSVFRGDRVRVAALPVPPLK